MLEGICGFRAGDQLITAGEGSFVSIPRATVHGLIPVGGRAKALVLFAHAAMEGYWEEVAAAAQAGAIDEAWLTQLQHQHHLEVVGPWAEAD